MKKARIIVFLALIAMLLFSCSNKNSSSSDVTVPARQSEEAVSDDNSSNQPIQNDTASQSSGLENKNQEPYYTFLVNNIEELFPDKKIINWVMPAPVMTNITEEHILDFDHKLNSKPGIDYVVQFILANSIYEYSLVIDKIISDGVNIDIFSTGFSSPGIAGSVSVLDPYYYFYNKGYLYPLDDYLTGKNGSILYASYIPELWEGLKLDNSIYGLSMSYYLNAEDTLSISKAAAEEYKIDVTKFTPDIASIEEAAKRITQATGEPSVELGGDLAAVSAYLGYQYVCGTVVIDKETDKAVNLFETDSFLHYISTLREFVLSGYIDPDVFHNIGSAPITFNTTESGIYSDDVMVAQLYDLKAEVPRTALCIYKASANPTEALDLLTLLHSDTDFADAFIYGENSSADVLFHWYSSLYLSTSTHSDEERKIRNNIAAYNAGIELDRYSTFHFNINVAEETISNINQILCEYIYPQVNSSKTETSQVQYSFLTGHTENPLQIVDEINAKMKAAGLDALLSSVNESLANH